MSWRKIKRTFLKAEHNQKTRKLAKMLCSAFLKITYMKTYMVRVQNLSLIFYSGRFILFSTFS